MKKSNLPKTDSIHKPAQFWDTQDLIDFEGELEELTEPIFVRGTAIKVHLEAREAKVVEQMAQAKGVSQEELSRAGALQKLARRKSSGRSSG